MGWSRDYRGYVVDPPCEMRRTWSGMPTLEGMPWLTARCEADLRTAIDQAWELSPPPPLPHVFTGEG